jgi:hypothetical protein
MPIEIDQKTLRAAITALKIGVPVYSALKLTDGTIQITTRNGTQKWKPPTKKRKTQTPQRTRGKSRTSPGGKK